MARLRSNFEVGTTTNNPLTSGGTLINSAAFADLPVISGGDLMAITLDPDELAGTPEIVHLTDHAASATVATAVRGREGTAARTHALGTAWVNALTAQDIDDIYTLFVPLAGGSMSGLLVLSADPAAALGAATKQYVDAAAGGDVSWDDIDDKPLEFIPVSHTHDAGELSSGTLDMARIPTGSTGSTVALGNHTHQYISSVTPVNVVGNSFAGYRIRNIFISSTTPTSTGRQTGDLWFDTS